MENIQICRNFDSLCRLCLVSGVELINIFGDSNFGQRYGDEPMSAKIFACTSLEVIENDDLPNCICKTCSMKIVRAFEFRQLAKRSNEILRRFVQDKAFKRKQEQAEKQLHNLFNNKNGSLRQMASEQLEIEPLAYCVKVEHEDDDENGLECDNDELTGEQNLIADVDPSASMMEDDDSEEDPAGLPNDEMMEHEFEPAWMNNGNDDSQPEDMEPKNPWNCQYCNTTFPNEERFKRHSLIHTSEPPFPCDYCDESFDLRTDLKAHWRVHSDGNPHICQMCGKSFPDRMSYLQHSDLHDQVKPYRCPVCKKSFCYGSDLRKHAITHTGVRPYVCSVCGNSFTRSTSLNKHLRMHNGNRPFKCPACPKIFGSRGDLKRHQIIHSGIKPWICTVCSVPFNRKDKLVRHEKLHSGEPRPFQCYECPTSFSRKEDLTKHIQFHHYKPPADMENATSNGSNTETIENSTLDQISKSDLERGNRTFRALIKEAFSGNQGWNQSTTAATPVSATVTISSVSSPAVAAATPTDKEESPFKCDICHKRFTHKASLDAHQKIHTAIKPFGCSMCEKSFYRRRELSRHEAVHTGYKPYSCGVCGKCFSRTDKLNRHVQTHQYKSIYRNYDCSACTLNFRSELELEKHKPLCRVLPLEAMLVARSGSGLANGSRGPDGSQDELEDVDDSTNPDGFYPEVMVKEEPVEDEVADGYDDDDEDMDPQILGSKIFTSFLTSSPLKRNMSISEANLQKLITQLPPPLSTTKHKGEAGRIGIIGGSLEYTGAPYYAGITALKCGADLAYIFCMRDAAAPIKSYSPELMVLPYLDSNQGYTLTTSRLHNIHSLVIGPGLGEDKEVHSLVVAIIDYIKKNEKLSSKISLVFDADGIGLLANNKDILRDYAGTVYLTPNANEIKKLILAFMSTDDMNKPNLFDQLVYCISPNAVLILKGLEDRIIARGYTSNCSVLGSLRRIGGQGDLLSGSLGVFSYWATLLGKDKQEVPAALLAAYSACSVTRWSSRLAFKEKGRSMITSDMIAQVGKAFERNFAP